VTETTAARAGADRSERPARWGLVVGACVAISVVSLAVPATLAYDPWAWLVWGREVGRWTLDTFGGPSWKPLPVAVTALLAPLGGLAVPAYTVLARTAALLGVVVIARLAGRLGGPVAAVLAGGLIWLTPDGDPRFLRYVLEGHEAPWSAALAVAALAAFVRRRPDRALFWLWLLSLLRPEAWPFLLALVAWTWVVQVRPDLVPFAQIDHQGSIRANGTMRWWGIGALVSIPLLWFVLDWIGSGSLFHGAETAQVLAGESTGARLGESLGTLAGMVPVFAWVLAGVAVASSWRRADRVPAALAAAALAWSAVVVAMAAVAGYAALGRFFLPGAAVLVALAGAGAVELVRLVRSTAVDRRVLAAGVAAVIVGVGLAVPRVAGLADVSAEVAARGRLADDLDRSIEAAGGAAALRRCGTGVISGGTLLGSAVAWKLDLPMSDVRLTVPDRPAVLVLESALATEQARARPGTVELAVGERWTVFAERCDPGIVDG
jgi:hypothetical protein